MMNALKKTVKGTFSYFGFNLVRKNSTNVNPFSAKSYDHEEIINKIKNYTMTSKERQLALIDAVEYVVNNNINGAFVECGVWKGGSAMAMMLKLLDLKVNDRYFYLYDTYEGMTAPSDRDVSWDGKDAATQLQYTPKGTGIWCLAQLEEVRNAIKSTCYPEQMVHFVQGRVEESIPKNAPDQIAILRLDTDWYESTKHELEHLFTRLSKGGVLIIDDYGFWKGARQATDEYLNKLPFKPLLHRIDTEGRMLIKP